MFETFLAVLGALLCWTIITEGCIFVIQAFAVRKANRLKQEFLAKNPDFLTSLLPHNKYSPFYQGYGVKTPTETGNEDGGGSGQYL